MDEAKVQCPDGKIDHWHITENGQTEKKKAKIII